MAIEDVAIDGQTISNLNSVTPPIRIPPGHKRLEFRYTALSLVAPEKLKFKYRLEGLESEWVEAGAKRAADYSFIPPGSYTFHVIACNNDGIWNNAGQSLSFTILPHFWQTWWFRSMSGTMVLAAVGGGVWFDTRRRMRRKLERLERQQAVERAFPIGPTSEHERQLRRVDVCRRESRVQLYCPIEGFLGTLERHAG